MPLYNPSSIPAPFASKDPRSYLGVAGNLAADLPKIMQSGYSGYKAGQEQDALDKKHFFSAVAQTGAGAMKEYEQYKTEFMTQTPNANEGAASVYATNMVNQTFADKIAELDKQFPGSGKLAEGAGLGTFDPVKTKSATMRAMFASLSEDERNKLLIQTELQKTKAEREYATKTINDGYGTPYFVKTGEPVLKKAPKKGPVWKTSTDVLGVRHWETGDKAGQRAYPDVPIPVKPEKPQKKTAFQEKVDSLVKSDVPRDMAERMVNGSIKIRTITDPNGKSEKTVWWDTIKQAPYVPPSASDGNRPPISSFRTGESAPAGSGNKSSAVVTPPTTPQEPATPPNPSRINEQIGALLERKGGLQTIVQSIKGAGGFAEFTKNMPTRLRLKLIARLKKAGLGNLVEASLPGMLKNKFKNTGDLVGNVDKYSPDYGSMVPSIITNLGTRR